LERERIESLACAAGCVSPASSAPWDRHTEQHRPTGQGVNRLTVDDIKRETVRAFKPLRCEAQDFDYDSGFEFSVFGAEDPALVYMGKLRTSQYQDPKHSPRSSDDGASWSPQMVMSWPLGPRRRDSLARYSAQQLWTGRGLPTKPDAKWRQLRVASQAADKVLDEALGMTTFPMRFAVARC
jgi:hypothetical protein